MNNKHINHNLTINENGMLYCKDCKTFIDTNGNNKKIAYKYFNDKQKKQLLYNFKYSDYITITNEDYIKEEIINCCKEFGLYELELVDNKIYNHVTKTIKIDINFEGYLKNLKNIEEHIHYEDFDYVNNLYFSCNPEYGIIYYELDEQDNLDLDTPIDNMNPTLENALNMFIMYLKTRIVSLLSLKALDLLDFKTFERMKNMLIDNEIYFNNDLKDTGSMSATALLDYGNMIIFDEAVNIKKKFMTKDKKAVYWITVAKNYLYFIDTFNGTFNETKVEHIKELYEYFDNNVAEELLLYIKEAIKVFKLKLKDYLV